MVPQSFFLKHPIDKTDFNQDWNCQPMCEDCNQDRGGNLAGWPLYKCSCHFLQVGIHDDEKYGLYIHETTGKKERTHLLYESQRRDEYLQPWGEAFAMSITMVKSNRKNTRIEWSSGSSGSPRGHRLGIICDWQMEAFNWFEKLRIGKTEKSDALVLIGPNKECCVYCADGRILYPVGASPAEFGFFDVAGGHRNIASNPYYRSDKRIPLRDNPALKGGWHWFRMKIEQESSNSLNLFLPNYRRYSKDKLHQLLQRLPNQEGSDIA